MSKRRRGAETAVALGVVLVWPTQDAHAHLVATGLGPIYDGIAHFALSPEDWLPVAALAMAAGLRGKDHVRRAILWLSATWLLAGIAALQLSGPAVSVPLWALLMALGVLVASDARFPVVVMAGAAMVLGGILGFANGTALAHSAAGFRELLGIVGALFVATTLVSAAVLALNSGWIRTAWRVAGSWIAASGLLLLGWSLRR